MRAARAAIVVACAVLGVAGFTATSGGRPLNHLPPARAPCSVLSGHPCHPSFCGVFERGPCLPYGEQTLPETLRLTIVTTDENDPNNKKAGDSQKADVEMLNNEDGNWSGADGDKPREETEASGDHELDSIKEMFAALRDCWIPPPKDQGRHGMEYTIRFSFNRDGKMIGPPRMTYASHDAPVQIRDVYRDAIDATFTRCTPLHFSEGMGEAVAGRPIAIRFVDDRAIDDASAR